MKAAARGSSMAANTLAEFAHFQPKKAGNPAKAALFYASSAEKGCCVGKHWTGVFCMEGFGVPKDLKKAEKNLKEAYKMGNGQSAFQLFLLYCSGEKKDLK
jgi:TPR repeat protein